MRDDGSKEAGACICVERMLGQGTLRATYEYNCYYWPSTQSWEVDVVSPHGWHDLSNEEASALVAELSLNDLLPNQARS